MRPSNSLRDLEYSRKSTGMESHKTCTSAGTARLSVSDTASLSRGLSTPRSRSRIEQGSALAWRAHHNRECQIVIIEVKTDSRRDDGWIALVAMCNVLESEQ